MGCFDTVVGNCPHCGAKVYLQSKAGGCTMESYSIEAVPGAIAADLCHDEHPCNTTCDKCNNSFRFQCGISYLVRCRLVKREDK